MVFIDGQPETPIRAISIETNEKASDITCGQKVVITEESGQLIE